MLDEWKCPRCNSVLREEDCQGYERSHKSYHHTRHLIMRWDCWSCSWFGTWQADSVSAPEEVALK